MMLSMIARRLQVPVRRLASTAVPKGMRRGAADGGGSSGVSPLLMAMPAIAFGLGTWQIFRKKQKEELIAVMEGKLSKEAVPLPTSVVDVAGMEYERVSVEGEFLHDQEIIVSPRTRTREAFSSMGDVPTPGAQIITPFRRADTGDVILVNRGFVTEDYVPPSKRQQGQVQGKQKLEGIVRLGEKKGAFVPENEPEKDEWRWIDIKTMSEARNTKPILIDVVEECTPPGGMPLGGQTQINIRNEHMQYIITWYSLAAATFAMLVVLRRNQGKRAARKLPPQAMSGRQ
ncbi:hypothetical protein PTSG_08459 [Salpingoeca rosetta]|uniref:SURF1-like protein n=1 Tax=Salpingoeca rosetta (strain ATCC 50818 / BSB-021) TaxID=946362 RepID=F2UJR7_SALR5|nr:uncharacterized protein PTSG_08459 [Salpingoeca rosetta]EGD77366.1 hypothetical protein PTSG_08459 [Salpingoeca rosetta]|eukprot:XP_004990710.1 hypothetical protein PTSG_08459 [Salpingoeca rosetta]